MFVLLHRETHSASTPFFGEIDFFVNRKSGFIGIIGNDFGCTAGWCEQHVFFIDFHQIVDNGRNDGGFPGTGISFQYKNLVIIIIGNELGYLLEENILF